MKEDFNLTIENKIKIEIEIKQYDLKTRPKQQTVYLQSNVISVKKTEHRKTRNQY